MDLQFFFIFNKIYFFIFNKWPLVFKSKLTKYETGKLPLLQFWEITVLMDFLSELHIFPRVTFLRDSPVEASLIFLPDFCFFQASVASSSRLWSVQNVRGQHAQVFFFYFAPSHSRKVTRLWRFTRYLLKSAKNKTTLGVRQTLISLSFFRASLPEFYAKRLTRAVLTHMKFYK